MKKNRSFDLLKLIFLGTVGIKKIPMPILLKNIYNQSKAGWTTGHRHPIYQNDNKSIFLVIYYLHGGGGVFHAIKRGTILMVCNS